MMTIMAEQGVDAALLADMDIDCPAELADLSPEERANAVVQTVMSLLSARPELLQRLSGKLRESIMSND